MNCHICDYEFKENDLSGLYSYKKENKYIKVFVCELCLKRIREENGNEIKRIIT